MLSFGAALLIVVVVQPDPAPAHRRALEAACSAAVDGSCVMQDPAAEQRSDAVAIVSLDSQSSRAVVQLGRTGNAKEGWLRRTLEFAPEDDEVERYRAIGLTIATLVGDSQSELDAKNAEKQAGPALPTPQPGPSPPPPPQPPAPAPAVPPSAGPRAATFPWLTVSGSLVAGPGLDSGPWRAGASLRSSLRLWPAPLQPTLSASRATLLHDHRGFAASWTRLTGGLSLWFGYAPWDAKGGVRLEAALEGLSARQREPRDRGSRWVGGVVFGADLLWPSSAIVAAYAHADLLSLEGGTALTSGGTRFASSPGNTYSVGLGVQLRVR